MTGCHQRDIRILFQVVRLYSKLFACPQVVVIQESKPGASRDSSAVVPRRCDAAVFLFQRAHILLNPQPLSSAIGGPVIHHNYLEIIESLVSYGLNRFLQEIESIEGGNYNAYESLLVQAFWLRSQVQQAATPLQRSFSQAMRN